MSAFQPTRLSAGAVRKGSFGSKPEKLNESKCFPLFTNNGHRQDTSACPKSADIVAKVFFG
jgi:hypothetical protein